MNSQVDALVLISADAEWSAIRQIFPLASPQPSPYGEWFWADFPGSTMQPRVMFFHGGWGKIAAAASTQYAIDRWSPTLLVNLGTCGGFEGQVALGTVILAEKTIVYDILEQMGDFDAHIAHYTTNLDLGWLGKELPHPVLRTLLVSGDRDLISGELPWLREKFGAVAGDWESGAIAFVAARNHTRLLILRGVSDLVGGNGSEAYGNLEAFSRSARSILASLVASLPAWLRAAGIR